MTNRIPDYLKLHVEEPPKTDLGKRNAELDRLSAAFSAVTGFRLSIDERADSPQLTFPWTDQSTVGYRVALVPTKGDVKPTLENRRELETALANLLSSLSKTRHELRRREAELAASVPVISVDHDGEHLAERLQGVLQATADMLQCPQAGLYLLDEATTSLKLRAHLGLPADALLQSPRRLEEAIADIEAMAGHAVVIDNCEPQSHWNVPQQSDAAICVPVASATTILGTLWFFRDAKRTFTPTEQNLAEITAGRLAADLERAVLVQEVRSLRGQRAAAREAETLSDYECLKVAPFLEGWEVSDAQTSTQDPSSFSHWYLAGEQRLHLAVGAPGESGRLAAVAMQATHAAHTQHDPSVRGLFSRVNESLWTASSEVTSASLFHGILDPTTGALVYATAGTVFAYVLRPHGWEPLLVGRQAVGADVDLKAAVHRQVLMPGDALVVMNGVRTVHRHDQDHGMNLIAEKMLRNTHLSAWEMARVALKALEKRFAAATDTSFSVVVAKRADD